MLVPPVADQPPRPEEATTGALPAGRDIAICRTAGVGGFDEPKPGPREIEPVVRPGSEFSPKGELSTGAGRGGRDTTWSLAGLSGARSTRIVGAAATVSWRTGALAVRWDWKGFSSKRAMSELQAAPRPETATTRAILDRPENARARIVTLTRYAT